MQFKFAPLTFVDNGKVSAFGGFKGAVDVSRQGGGAFPAYITAAIPCFLLMILAEIIILTVYNLPSVAGR